MNRNKRIEELNEHKSLRKISSESRKDGKEIDIKTSENTPKSHSCGYLKSSFTNLINDKTNQIEEKSKERVPEIIPVDNYGKPSPITARFNRVSDCMSQFQKFKDEIYEQSPMPCLPFLKRDSSVGEEGPMYSNLLFELANQRKECMMNTPNLSESNRINPFTLCKKPSGNYEFSNKNGDNIYVDADMEELPIIREFSLAPHQHIEERSEIEVEPRRHSQDVECNGGNVVDSICEMFEMPNYSLLDNHQQQMKVCKSNKKIHKRNIDSRCNKYKEMRIKVAKTGENFEKSQDCKQADSTKEKCESQSKNKALQTKKIQQKEAGNKDSSISKKREMKLKLKASELSDQELIESNCQNLNSSQSSVVRVSLRIRNKESKAEECKGCTCKKSQCIKLYCECFISKGFCSPSCSCEDCFNMEENEEEITKIRNKIASRNPHAFKSKVKVEETNLSSIEGDQKLSSQDIKTHIKGCNCKRSQCSNNYCECHQNGAKCTELCACTECKNKGE